MSTNRPLAQAPAFQWNRANTQQLDRDSDFIYQDEVAYPTEKHSPFWHSCNNVLGKPYQAALLTHSDNFEPAARPARVAWNAPSPGVRARIAHDEALRNSPEGAHILALMAREERSDWFASLARRLGKPITPEGASKPKQNGTSARIISDSGDASDAGYFERLRGMLGGK